MISHFDSYAIFLPNIHRHSLISSEEQEVEASEDIEALKAENTLLRSRLRIYDKLSHLIASETPIAEIDYFKSELSIEVPKTFFLNNFLILSLILDEQKVY